ncbi:hypothetical protein [Cyclobacterium sp.]|uniref:hypothetical protein n=1 Tax=Cyclobacterium sp. TaxID=1966343 RepID=UPI0025C4B036|nr:hypothetical protein [Cyclobacterium sp.]
MPRDDYKYQPDTHLIATGELYLWTMMYTGRWKQRFSNYRKAFKQLEEAVGLADTRDLSRLQKQGLKQSFENTH